MAADLVTLSWCLGEIREALAQTDRLLERQLSSGDDDLASLRAARASLHQAHGALQVVAIEGTSLITEEAERLLDAIERGDVILNGKVASRLSRAFTALVEHLETLLRDVPNQPLYLFPYYRSLLETRRADRIHPSDLFFPDLSSVRPAEPVDGYRTLDAAVLSAARAGFERGLLLVMRGGDARAGATAMAAAIEVVGNSQVGAASRAFWWVAQAWFEALRAGALAVDLPVKRLLGRLNLQLRKTIEERAPVAGQLTREMLFALARVDAALPRVVEVRAAFALAQTVPDDFETPHYGRMDAGVLRTAREAIAKARGAFDKVTRGSAGELAAFSLAIDAFGDCVQQMPAEGLRALGRALVDVRARLASLDGLPGEGLSLELATAILFAEQALEDGARPGSDHDRHGHEMARRLAAAFDAGGPAAGEMPAWLLALSRAAQDRMTMISFVTETGNNLRAVEKSLDAFFRDPSQREDLPACVRALHQVAGALRLLGHHEAAAGAESVAGRVAALADAGPEEGEAAGFERIASSVGAIGFFVEGLQRPDRPSGRFEYDEATGDFHAHITQSPLPRVRAGAVDPALPQAATMAAVDVDREPSEGAVEAAGRDEPAQPSAESVLEGHLEAAASLFAALDAQPDEPLLRATLRETLMRIRDGAMLLDRADRRQGADEAVAVLDAAGEIDLPGLARALAAAGVPVPAPLAPATPVPTDAAAVDDELLGIFLGEAEEVLSAIDQHAALSRATPSDVQYLTTIRRGFHTLKGSSRMVGLAGFGEAGWALEQVMNQWLADERPGSELLYELVDEAVACMSDWVRALREDPASAAAIDPAALVARADAVRSGRISDAPSEDVLVDAADAELPASDVDAVFVTPIVEDAMAQDAALADAVAEHAVAEHAVADDAMAPSIVSVQGGAEPGPVDEPLAEGAGSPADDTPTVAEDIVIIGGREISRPLYMIFLAEADDLLACLVGDVAQWQAQPARGATPAATRAAHSLKGSSAIVGLDGVHRIAQRLEAFMHAQKACGEAPASDELAVLGRSVERMQAMLHQFAGGADPGEAGEALAAIDALALAWQAKLKPGRQALPDPDDLDAATEQREILATSEAQEASEPPAASFATLLPEAEDAEAAAVVVPPDEIDPDLLPVFIEEAEDDLPGIGENLRSWLARPGDASLPQTLMRQLHTVKGGARMAGAMGLGQRVHEIETRVESMVALPAVPAALIEELVAEHDRVVEMFEALKRGPAPAAAPVEAPAPVAGIAQQDAALADAALADAALASPAPAMALPAGDAAAPGAPQPDGDAAAPAAPPLRGHATAPASAAPTPPAPRAQPLVRVRADLLDRLVNEAGEVSIARSRLDNGFTGLRQSLADLTENVSRLRSQLREIEIQAETQIQARIAQRREHERDFDPLEFDRFTRFQELTRMLAESVNDVATVQHNAMRALEESSQDLHRQGQVLRDLQQNLMRVRMLQFGSIGDRLYRVVRQAAKELDKRVHLDIRGSGVEIDRSVLERMAGPIEHLLRNAVAHGIESRERRIAAGKPETGEIVVEVRQEGREIVLSFADDGGGLDRERIRARALSAGLIQPDAVLGDRELGDLIFTPGFSTADSVTEISGRGVGMDVVRSEVAALGGRIETDSTPGQGTRFTINLPLTLAVSQVVLVSAGKARFAVPSSSVEQLLQLKPQALATAYAERSVEWQGTRVPLFFLGSLVDLPDLNPLAQHYSPVLVLRSGHQRIALHCDEVTRNQEVVVKSVGPQAARVRGVTGATVLGNGDIVLIVNPVAFAQIAAGEVLDRVVKAPAISAVMADALPPVVMVVDDSVTVRKVTQRLLAREGYQVMLAKDGVDALRQLEETVPDVMLLDIEMPRMDGFDLTRHLRGDERYRDIPIVMISSRTADKHRNHAMSLGVNVFLGKPYGEAELLAEVAGFTANRRRAAVA